jgi:hypothetical protein
MALLYEGLLLFEECRQYFNVYQESKSIGKEEGEKLY